MSIMGRVIGVVLRPFVERQARGRSLEAFASSLEGSGDEVAARLERAADTSHNQEVANHIIGIERWGQRRLRVVLGEPLVLDTYRGYRLPEGTDLAALRRAFAETRTSTVELVRELAAADLEPTIKVRHNDLGEVSIGGWLSYLEGHAKRECIRLKGGHG